MIDDFFTDDSGPTTLADDASFTTPLGKDVIIYPHAFSVRLRFNVDVMSLRGALAHCGWTRDGGSDWKRDKPRGQLMRYSVRGSTTLTGRAPKKESAMARMNRKWGTRLYSVGIDDYGDRIHVDLHGVRERDIQSFVERVLLIARPAYATDYFRSMERYIVLTPQDAEAVAARLGWSPTQGRGPQTRKQYLGVDYEIPVTVRHRSKAVARAKLYRITRGATAGYRLEIALRGNRRDKTFFAAEDACVLDGLLLQLVAEHGLRPRPKPCRWEPVLPATQVERRGVDDAIRRIGQKGYRGRLLRERELRLLRKCHTPLPSEEDETVSVTAAYPSPPCLRTVAAAVPSSEEPSEEGLPLPPIPLLPSSVRWICTAGEGTGIRSYIPEGASPTTMDLRERSPLNTLVQEIHRLPGMLIEVVVSPEYDPSVFVRQLLAESPTKNVGVGLLAMQSGDTYDTWHGVNHLAADHPIADAAEFVVLVVDASAMAYVSNATLLFNEDRLDWPTEPGYVAHMFPRDPLAAGSQATGAIMWDSMKELRATCESTGCNVVFVTVDTRPDHATGPLQTSHLFRDYRFRSAIGDAGRYWSHERYRIERAGRRVVAIKDEAEGRGARLL